MVQIYGRIFVILLVTAMNVDILQAAPGERAPRQADDVAGTSEVPLVTNDKPAATDEKPATSEKPATNNNKPLAKPETLKPTVGQPSKPADGVALTEGFNNCWTCLLEAAQDLCSYLLDWSSPNKFSSVNFLSLFQERSSEESSENSDDSAISTISSLFRFRRSVPTDLPGGETAFLDLLHGFYLKTRERFLRENPGKISTSIDNIYKRPDELAEIAAYILGVRKDLLLQVYRRMKSKEIGEILLKALDERVSSGEQRTVNRKLTPTSVSYFFQELLASMNGIATGLTEIFGIALQNLTQQQTTQNFVQ